MIEDKPKVKVNFTEIIQFIQNEKIVSKKKITGKFGLSTGELDDILEIFDNHGFLQKYNIKFNEANSVVTCPSSSSGSENYCKSCSTTACPRRAISRASQLVSLD